MMWFPRFAFSSIFWMKQIRISKRHLVLPVCVSVPRFANDVDEYINRVRATVVNPFRERHDGGDKLRSVPYKLELMVVGYSSERRVIQNVRFKRCDSQSFVEVYALSPADQRSDLSPIPRGYLDLARRGPVLCQDYPRVFQPQGPAGGRPENFLNKGALTTRCCAHKIFGALMYKRGSTGPHHPRNPT
jgi:hypothetical protein